MGGLQADVIRPSFTLGGAGGGIVWNAEDFDAKVTRGLELSPVHEVLIEECLFGWKEYELELLRDAKGQRRHHLLDRERGPDGRPHGRQRDGRAPADAHRPQYQALRDAAIKAMRSIGTFAGGCNIQFAVDPATGRMIVIEINPRVSRSRRRSPPRRPATRSPKWPRASRRLHARRAAERGHRHDVGLLRARPRLRGHESAALQLRQVRGRRRGAHDPDEGRR